MQTEFFTNRYVPAKDVATMIRNVLKKEFPGVKFSVKTDRATAITVSWTDGPTVAQVDPLIELYKAGRFDGMTDSYEYDTTLWAKEDGTIEEFSSGAEYIFSNRTISDEWRNEIFALFTELTGEPLDPKVYGDWNKALPLFIERNGKVHAMGDGTRTYVQELFGSYTRTRVR